MASRMRNPKGKRGRHPFEDITIQDIDASIWTNATTNRDGSPIGKKERETQVSRAVARMEAMTDAFFNEVNAIVTGKTEPSTARASVINKLLDKMLPDLRAAVGNDSLTQRSIRTVLIQGPLKRMQHAGITIATQETLEAEVGQLWNSNN